MNQKHMLTRTSLGGISRRAHKEYSEKVKIKSSKKLASHDKKMDPSLHVVNMMIRN